MKLSLYIPVFLFVMGIGFVDESISPKYYYKKLQEKKYPSYRVLDTLHIHYDKIYVMDLVFTSIQKKFLGDFTLQALQKQYFNTDSVKVKNDTLYTYLYL